MLCEQLTRCLMRYLVACHHLSGNGPGSIHIEARGQMKDEEHKRDEKICLCDVLEHNIVDQVVKQIKSRQGTPFCIRSSDQPSPLHLHGRR